jgi:dTDP-4-amino-4,6-dideoxygalactose transaminase
VIKTVSTLAIDGGPPVRGSFLPFHRPLIDADDEQAVLDTLRSGWLTTGPKTKRFEAELAAYTAAKHCVAVNSGTAALHLALEAAGVGAGDEVITSPITFASTANVIVHRNATPVFVDVEPDTLTLDPARIEPAVTAKTKAIIPVDFAGHPCDLDSILEIARRHQLVVIEDAAHSLGAEYRGRRVGGIADLTAFSFYATKNITSAEGGALATENDAWAERAGIMALHGISRDAWKRYSDDGYQHWDIIGPGYKYNMPDLAGSLVLSQLGKLDAFRARRVALKARMDAQLRGIAEVGLLGERSDVLHAYHLYPVIVRTEALTADRDVIMHALEKENIGIGVHFRAVHLHPYYTTTFGFRRGMFPRAEYYSDRTISLPLYARMTDQDADDVVAAVHKVFAHFRR